MGLVPLMGLGPQRATPGGHGQKAPLFIQDVGPY